MKKKTQAHKWKVPAPPDAKNNHVEVVCSECGVKMLWTHLEGFGAEDFEKLYAYHTRLRTIQYGKPKDRLVLPDCNEEKIRRTHRS